MGRTALIQEALDFMIPETLDQALKDEDLQAFAEPQVEVLEIEPVSFKAVVPLEPVVDLGDYQNIRIDKTPVEITDEQVNDVIERLRRESAPWETADRGVEWGDLLNLNVKGSVDDEEVVNDQGVDYIPQEDNVLPFPGFAAHLEDMTGGQEKSAVGHVSGQSQAFEGRAVSAFRPLALFGQETLGHGSLDGAGVDRVGPYPVRGILDGRGLG